MIKKYRKVQFGENETLDGLTDTYSLNKERFQKMETFYTSKAQVGKRWKTRCPQIPWLFSMFPLGQHGAPIFRQILKSIFINMGVSENSVPLNPMVNDHYPY